MNSRLIVTKFRLVAHVFNDAQVGRDRNSRRREHIARDRRVGARKKTAESGVAQQSTPSRESKGRVGQEKSVDGDDPPCVRARQRTKIGACEGRSGDRVQDIDRNAFDLEFAKRERHVDSILRRLAEPEDSAAAQTEPDGPRRAQRRFRRGALGDLEQR